MPDSIDTPTPKPRIPARCFFVILFTGRSGSSHLVSSLNSHPSLLCYGEMFKGRSVEFQDKVLGHLIRGRPLEEISKQAMQSRYEHDHTLSDRPLEAVGFKTKPGDLEDKVGFIRFLHDHQFRVIHLTRSNYLKLALSSFTARRLRDATGYFNTVNPSEIQGAIEVDPDELFEKTRNRAHYEETLASLVAELSLPILKVTYERLLSNEQQVFDEIFNFLEVEPMPITGKILKNTSDKLSDAISNFDEIKNRFEGTDYEGYLQS